MTNQQIQSAIADLPDNVRKAVITFDWANEILDIGHDHGLHMDQIEAFRYETLMIILGHSSSNNYIENLKKHLDIKKNLAEELIGDANDRIFTELQRRAFRSDTNESKTVSTSYTSSDNYLEPIGHDDLRGPMAEHGVHLIDDESDFKPQTRLQNEIDQITGTLGVDPEPYESEIHQLHQEQNNQIEDPQSRPNTSLHQDPFHHDNVPVVDLPIDSVSIQLQKPVTQTKKIASGNDQGYQNISTTKPEKINTKIIPTNPYNEAIDESDFKGISGHRLDTDILKTKNHTSPESIFAGSPNDNHPIKQSLRDLGQGKTQKLDQRIMDNPFIAKNDYVNASPTDQEQIKENGTFLQNLKNTSE